MQWHRNRVLKGRLMGVGAAGFGGDDMSVARGAEQHLRLAGSRG